MAISKQQPMRSAEIDIIDAIDTLSTDVDSAVREIAALDDTISDITSSLGDITSSLGDMSQLDDTVTNTIITLDNNIESVESKLGQHYMIVVGDSWSNRSNHYISPNVGWADVVADRMHLTLVNKAQSGRGWLVGADTNDDFLSQLRKVETENQEVSPNDVSYIIAFGGINDYSASYTFDSRYEQIISAIRSFITYASNKYPNAKLVINPMQTPSPADSRFAWCCTMNGWLSMGMASSHVARLSTVGLNALNKLNYWTNDNIHPSDGQGMSILASCIMSELYGSHSIEFEPNALIPVSDNSIVSQVSFSNSALKIEDGKLYIPMMEVNFTLLQTLSANSETTIGNISSLNPIKSVIAVPSLLDVGDSNNILHIYKPTGVITMLNKTELQAGSYNYYAAPMVIDLNEIEKSN